MKNMSKKGDGPHSGASSAAAASDKSAIADSPAERGASLAPSSNLKVAIKSGFATEQLALRGDKLIVAENASRLIRNAVKQALLLNNVAQTDVIDLSIITQPFVELRVNSAVFYPFAELAIQAKYDQLGGKQSALGLPLNPAAGVQRQGKTYFMDFRGGKIEFNPLSGDPAKAIKLHEMEIWWSGLECIVRQEKTDEVYGGVGVIIPGSGLHSEQKFPAGEDYWEMGPDGQRIVEVNTILYKGPPMSMTLIGSLVEHDSGDTSAVKQKIADAIANAAKGLAAMAGVPAEALAADQGFIGDVSLGLVNGISSLFGADDDPLVPGQKVLHWEDILNQNYARQTLTRGDDPGKSLQYTHQIVVSGDGATYAFYFDVRQYDTVPAELHP